MELPGVGSGGGVAACTGAADVLVEVEVSLPLPAAAIASRPYWSVGTIVSPTGQMVSESTGGIVVSTEGIHGD